VILAASVIPWVLLAAAVAVIGIALAVGRSRREAGLPRDRRRHPRSESGEAILVKRDRRMDATYAIDMSLGGILIAGPEDLAVGDEVVVVIDERERPAKVLRITPQGYRALVFDG
jgi:hypothetical protein